MVAQFLSEEWHLRLLSSSKKGRTVLRTNIVATICVCYLGTCLSQSTKIGWFNDHLQSAMGSEVVDIQLLFLQSCCTRMTELFKDYLNIRLHKECEDLLNLRHPLLHSAIKHCDCFQILNWSMISRLRLIFVCLCQ